MPRQQHSLEKARAVLFQQRMNLGQAKRDHHKLLLWLLSSALGPSHSRKQEQELPFWGGREVGTPESHLEEQVAFSTPCLGSFSGKDPRASLVKRGPSSTTLINCARPGAARDFCDTNAVMVSSTQTFPEDVSFLAKQN